MLPGPSASEVTTLWHYTNLFIIIIIIIIEGRLSGSARRHDARSGVASSTQPPRPRRHFPPTSGPWSPPVPLRRRPRCSARPSTVQLLPRYVPSTTRRFVHLLLCPEGRFVSRNNSVVMSVVLHTCAAAASRAEIVRGWIWRKCRIHVWNRSVSTKREFVIVAA